MFSVIVGGGGFFFFWGGVVFLTLNGIYVLCMMYSNHLFINVVNEIVAQGVTEEGKLPTNTLVRG